VQVTNLYGNTTRLFSTPYLTAAEYKQAPTAIDYDNLVTATNDPTVQDAELVNVIARASSWIDTFCNQVIGSTLETEQQRVRMRPDGFMVIHPRYSPVSVLLSLSYGASPNALGSYLDPSQGWIEDQQIVIPYAANTVNQMSSAGPLGFGYPAAPGVQFFVKYTYVAGFPNTLLNADALAGATSITVQDSTGILPNTELQIYDGMATERVIVSSTYTYGSNILTLSAPLMYAHLSGVSVSALPPAIKEAAILVTTAFLKVRGDNSLTMQVTNQAGPSLPGSQRIDSDLALATGSTEAIPQD
jgi:hypothetical protein